MSIDVNNVRLGHLCIKVPRRRHALPGPGPDIPSMRFFFGSWDDVTFNGTIFRDWDWNMMG